MTQPFDIAPSTIHGEVPTPEFTESIIYGRARYQVTHNGGTYLDDLSAREALRLCKFLNNSCGMWEGEVV